jgi:trk system potassium uptake protein
MNFGTIRKTIGIILCIEAAFMLPSFVLSVVDGDENVMRGFASAITAVLIVGAPCGIIKSKDSPLGARDGFVTVALAWIIISLFGAIPFYISGVIPSISDAVFETVSGFTTTGATIMEDVESAPRAILLWRSITNWIGGMGVLVFLLAIAPVAREGGSMFLLRAEFPGPMAAKLVPRMQKSAKLLYEIYIVMTAAQIVLLYLGGIPLFDSINISLSTVSTGGFSIRNGSMASYGTYAQNITLVFMTLCSMSFSLFYCVLAREFFRLRRSRELRIFVIVVFGVALLMGIDTASKFSSLGEGIHHTLFQVISIISTTCYVSVDASFWSPFVWAMLTVLMITGPMSGSTGGGMKLSRVMILGKSTYRAIARTVTPNSVHLIHLDGEIVEEDTVSSVNSFVAAYFMAVIATAVVLSINGLSIGDGMLAAISGLSNVGYGIDSNTFSMGVSTLNIISKAVLCFDMFLGRLEIFPMLILFAPDTWKK